jgi:hypothetical protein
VGKKEKENSVGDLHGAKVGGKDDQGDGDEKLCAFQPAKITWSVKTWSWSWSCFSQQKWFWAVFFAAKMVLVCVFRRFVRASSWNACRPRLNNSLWESPCTLIDLYLSS